MVVFLSLVNIFDDDCMYCNDMFDVFGKVVGLELGFVWLFERYCIDDFKIFEIKKKKYICSWFVLNVYNMLLMFFF